MSELYEQLGQIGPLYQEYQEVIDAVGPDETVQVPWREEIVRDNLKKAYKSLPVDCDFDTFHTAIEKAKYSTYPARGHALLEQGFAGSILGLFKELENLEAGIESNPELLGRVALYEQIPAERRRGALQVTEQSYSWGGELFPLI